jgi:hypothetical protein
MDVHVGSLYYLYDAIRELDQLVTNEHEMPGEPGKPGEPGDRSGGTGGVGGVGGPGGMPSGTGGTGGPGGPGGRGGGTNGRFTPHRERVAAYVLVVTVAALGLWRVETTANRAEELALRVEEEAQIREDTTCVGSWDARERIREAILIPGEAIIEVADADPETIKQFRLAISRRVTETIIDPECNLDAAQKRLDNK